MFTSDIEDTMRVAAALELFEKKSGLDSAEFEDRYARGDFAGSTWALAWHSLVADMSPRPRALAV